MGPRLMACAVAALALPSPALGWGTTGHRVIATIADRRLTAETRAEVAALLGPESLADVSTWADAVRRQPEWRHAESWHYVNIPAGVRYADSEKNPLGDVVEAISRYSRVLSDRGQAAATRAEALRFLVHFVGDVHQPLHAGHLEDRGGNEVPIVFRGQAMDLHDLWDWSLVAEGCRDVEGWVALLDPPGPPDEPDSTTPVDWADESRALCPAAYEVGDGVLGDAYAARHGPLVARRLRQAGRRLAALLESLLAAPPP